MKSLEEKPSVKLKIYNQETLPELEVSSVKIVPVRGNANSSKGEQVTRVISFFNTNFVEKNKIPMDSSFSAVLTALKKAKKSDEAKEIFELVYKYSDPNVRNEVIGPWSYTAMLQIIRSDIKRTDPHVLDELLVKVKNLLAQYKSRDYEIDVYIASEIMSFYAAINDFEEVIRKFKEFKKVIDDAFEKQFTPYLSARSTYTVALIKTNQVSLAIRQFTELKEIYKENRRTKEDEGSSIQAIYSAFIKFYCEDNLNKAICFYEEAVKDGLYKKNNIKNLGTIISVRVGLREEYKTRDNALLMCVSKVALLSFLRNVSQGKVIFSKKERQAINEKSKNLNKEYTITVEWKFEFREIFFRIPCEGLLNVSDLQNFAICLNADDFRFEDSGHLKEKIESEFWFNNLSEAVIFPEDISQAESTLIQKGMRLFDMGYYESAKPLYEKLIHNRPQSSWLHACLGFVLFRKEEFKPAICAFKNAISLGADNIAIYNNLGIAYELTSGYSEALKVFLKISKMQPTYEELYLHLGSCYRKLGNIKLAIEAYKEGIRQADMTDNMQYKANCYYELGKLYEVSGNSKKADSYFESYGNPSSSRAHTFASSNYWRSSKTKKPRHQQAWQPKQSSSPPKSLVLS